MNDLPLHDCKIYHYGNQTMIRPCCVDSCVARARDVKRNSVSIHSNNYLRFQSEWNMLSCAEMKEVGERLAGEGITELCDYPVLPIEEKCICHVCGEEYSDVIGCDCNIM